MNDNSRVHRQHNSLFRGRSRKNDFTGDVYGLYATKLGRRVLIRDVK